MTSSPSHDDGPDLPVRVLYVGGVGRSGSTVLGRALAAVEGVVSVGEVVHIWSRGLIRDERCGCGERFSSCPFWRGVGDRAFGGWHNVNGAAMEALRMRVDRNRYLPWLLAESGPPWYMRTLTEYERVLKRLYRGIADESGARVVIDTSKHPSFARVLHLTPGVDLRVLHLVRDVRGVAYSWTKTIERPEVDGLDYMQGDSPARLARHWLVTNSVFDVAQLCGARTLRVRYEDLVTDPRNAMLEMLTFAGVANSQRVSDALAGPGLTIPVQHEVSGNPMRFGGEQLRLRSDEVWRQKLSSRDQALALMVGRPLMLRYGY